jgi:hypothetical protein
MKNASSLIELLDEEAGSFQRLDNTWRPKDLFFELQTQALMRDMRHRYEALKTLEGDLKRLPRADLYLKLTRQLSFIIRRAKFVRQFNQLVFGQAVAEFYTAYGQVLRYLRIDQARGLLQPV